MHKKTSLIDKNSIYISTFLQSYILIQGLPSLLIDQTFIFETISVFFGGQNYIRYNNCEKYFIF